MAQPTGGTWSNREGLITAAGVFTPAQAGKFVAVYSRGTNTCLRKDSVTITVNALPVVTITPVKNPICFGDSTTLTAAGGDKYLWSPTTGLSASDKAVIKAGPATSTLYTVTVTDMNGCVDTAQLNLRVTPLPVVDAGADQEFCNQPVPVTLMPTPTGGKWTGATQVTEAGVFTPSGLGTFKLRYTYTDPATGCTNFDTMTVRVIAPEQLTLPNDTVVCINTPALNLMAQPTGGTWSNREGLITAAGVFTPAQAGKFVAVYSRGTNTCLRKDSVTITVNALPVVTITPVKNPICFGDSTTLTAAGGDKYLWSPTTGLSASDKAVIKAGPATSTLYTVTVTDVNGCVDTAQLNLRVTPLPVVDAGADQEFCNQPIPVTLMPSPGGGKWSGGTQVTEAGVFTPSGLGTFKLLYTYTDPTTGCINFDTTTIRVIAPDSLILPKDTAVCISTPALNLIARPAGGSWKDGDGLVTSAGVFSPTKDGKFSLVYSRGEGTCLRTDTMIVTVYPLPTTVIIADKNPICFGDTSNLSASGGIFYQWSPSTGLSAIDRIQLKANPRVTTTYTVTVTDQNTCVNTSEIILVVNPLPIVNAGNDTSYCINPNPIPLAPATPSGGRWSGSGIVDPVQGTFNSAQVGVGRWPLIYTFEDANQCVNRDTVLISVVEPVIPEAGLNDTVCIYDTPFMLKGFSPTNLDGRWSGRGITDARAALFSPAAAGVGVHTLIFTVGQGSCAYSDSIQMMVADYPTTKAGNDLERCVDAPAVQLADFSPLGGVWSGRSVSQQGLFQPAQAGAGVYFLVYTYQDPVTRCINRDSIQVTVNPLPIVSAGRDTTYCDNPNPVDIKLQPATPIGGRWSGAGIVDPVQGIFRTDRAGGRGMYSIVYTYTDPKGCDDSDTIRITVIDPVLAQVKPRDTLCFANVQDTLIGIPQGGTWTGPGIVDRNLGIFDPVAAAKIRKDGRYTTYQLIYSFGAGTCETKDTLQYLVVNLEGEVEAGNDFAVCLSEPAFNLSQGRPIAGYWEGQGITNSTNGTFIAIEAGVGTHILKYFFIDPISGCLGFDSVTAIVHPIPQAGFAELEEACISKPVEFKNTTTGALTYFWDFGDGKTSTERNPIHRYDTTGEFTIRLIATTEFGCIDSAKQTIFVTEPPMAAFEQDKNKGCGRELCVNFKNQSTGYKVSYFWDFGNGDTTSMAQPPQICFKQSNYQDTTYFVQLNVTNLCGTVYDIDSVIVQPVPSAIFAVDRDQDCSPFKVQLANRSIGNPKTYLWDFGPGIPLSTDSLPEAPTYTTDTIDRVVPIKLIARNTCGADTFVMNIRVLPNNLRAFFNTEPIVGCQPLEVNFTSFSTGANLVHNWTFGDGNASTLMSPIHTYDTSGVFKVILKIDNGCGFDTAQAMVRVNPAPKVVYAHAPTICAKDSLVFNNVSPNTLGAVWDFGDGQTSTLRNPKHVYADSGTYTLKLTVFAETTGCPASDSSIVRVLPNPKPGFRHPKDGCVPLNIALINTSSNGKYYWWDFGDDNTSTEREPKHEYLAAGRYTIALAVSDSLGCTGDTLRSEILIHPKPKSVFVPLINKVCGLPLQVNFLNTSEGASGFEWTFGNGSSSKLREPSTSYKDSGLYTIRLIVSNPFTCKDTSFQKIRALATPLADFEIDPPVGCQPFRPSITNLSMGANQAFWRSSDGQISREFTPKFFYPNTGVYTVTLVSGAYGLCFDTLTIDSAITVKPSPNAGFRYEESNTEPPDGTVIFTNESSADAIKFKWDFGDNEESELRDPTHRYFQNAPVTVTLVVENSAACTDTATKTINFRFIKGLFVPNAFTPETGPEDVRIFLPSGVGLRRYKLSIYSRWGQLLWESTKLTQEGRPEEGWDGYYNGSLMPQDVYVWKVEAEFDDDSIWKGSPDRKKRIRTSGTVHLLR